MKSIRHLLIIVFLLSGKIALTQDFLDAHVGTYKGTLYLLYPNGKQDSVEFELLIQPAKEPGRWTNTVRYMGENGAIGQVKEYELVVDTTVKDGAHYILDEKDGILISEVRIGKSLYANYMVDHIAYHVTTTFETTYIDYELSCYDMLHQRTSESEPDEENIRWKVDSLPLLSVQKGRLYKQ